MHFVVFFSAIRSSFLLRISFQDDLKIYKDVFGKRKTFQCGGVNVTGWTTTRACQNYEVFKSFKFSTQDTSSECRPLPNSHFWGPIRPILLYSPMKRTRDYPVPWVLYCSNPSVPQLRPNPRGPIPHK